MSLYMSKGTTDKAKPIHYWDGHGVALCGESVCGTEKINHLDVIRTIQLRLEIKEVTCTKCTEIYKKRRQRAGLND